jgi:hypothetical protein
VAPSHKDVKRKCSGNAFDEKGRPQGEVSFELNGSGLLEFDGASKTAATVGAVMGSAGIVMVARHWVSLQI